MKKYIHVFVMPLVLFSYITTTNAKNQKRRFAAQPPLIPHQPNFASLPKQAIIEKISKTPYILCIYNFITDEEAEYLKQAAQPLLKKSLVVGSEKIGVDHPSRTSSSAFLSEIKSDHITNIIKRAADFLNTTPNLVEGLQVVHYKDHQRYDPHFDYFNRDLPVAKETIGIRGQRVATLLVYLNSTEPNAGGETFFPVVAGGLKIRPQKNMAVFWYNVRPDGHEDEKTLHGGLPITRGEKYAVNIWVRDPKLINPPELVVASNRRGR